MLGWEKIAGKEGEGNERILFCLFRYRGQVGGRERSWRREFLNTLYKTNPFNIGNFWKENTSIFPDPFPLFSFLLKMLSKHTIIAVDL